MGKVIRYIITAKENFGGRRWINEFKTLTEARAFIKKLTTPGKLRKIVVSGKKKTIRLTSFRGGISGTGINNPRIKKIMVFR